MFLSTVFGVQVVAETNNTYSLGGGGGKARIQLKLTFEREEY